MRVVQSDLGWRNGIGGYHEQLGDHHEHVDLQTKKESRSFTLYHIFNPGRTNDPRRLPQFAHLSIKIVQLLTHGSIDNAGQMIWYKGDPSCEGFC